MPKPNTTMCTAIFAAATLIACTNDTTSTRRADARASAPQAPASEVDRGRYLVMTSGCHDCHTPFVDGPNGSVPDMTRALSGHPASLVMPPAPKLPPGPWLTSGAATNTAWAGPWGVSFTANLTPDPETGLGKWTRQNFIDTIKNGRHMGGGRRLLPPMPAPVYANMTEDDLGAIFAYLKTLPPISNKVPEAVPPVVTTSLTKSPGG